MSDLFELLSNLDEPYAAGYFECPDKGRIFRFAHAQRRFWESVPLAPYDGGKLYPCGKVLPKQHAVLPNFSYTFWIDDPLLNKKCGEAADTVRKEMGLLAWVPEPHCVGGNGYTHSFPHYQRVIFEGLDSYSKRVQKIADQNLREGLLEVLKGIEIYHGRCLDVLERDNAPDELISALRQVPFKRARTLYEAIVCWNFIYYIDGCDNPGRLDADLIDFYKGEDATDLFHELFLHVDLNEGWSCALGPQYNPLTLQCLKAIKGVRRPNIELRVTDDMPLEIWEAAAESIMSGCGQPALYNETAYQDGLHKRFPDIPKSDLLRFNGGGCTETMLAGLSNVGSLDAGFNAAYVFANYMNEALPSSFNFDEFYNGFMEHTKAELLKMLDDVNELRRVRAEIRPQPVRSLLIDDCIDKGIEYNKGGARYNWSVVNVAGLINVIDSLLAIKHLVYEKKQYSPEQFLTLLKAQDAAFLKALSACPCFGVDDSEADALARKTTADIYSMFSLKTPYLGRAFLPSSIQFTTYSAAGVSVSATPDGRSDGQPLCDSIGAVHGKDKKGITALLCSVSSLPLYEAIGTPVLNIRLQKKFVKDYLNPLVMGFFNKGGMQMQVSCISKEEMLDALEHPEKHENLIVRIGGFSEYFNRLGPELKQTVIDRTDHAV